MPLRRVNEICEELYEEQLRVEAMPYMPGAVEKLAILAENGSDAVARQAANDLIALGAEKPKSKTDEFLDKIGDRVINVTVMQFPDTGKPIALPPEKVVIQPGDVIEAEVVELPEGAAKPAALFNFNTHGEF